MGVIRTGSRKEMALSRWRGDNSLGMNADGKESDYCVRFLIRGFCERILWFYFGLFFYQKAK